MTKVQHAKKILYASKFMIKQQEKFFSTDLLCVTQPRDRPTPPSEVWQVKETDPGAPERQDLDRHRQEYTQLDRGMKKGTVVDRFDDIAAAVGILQHFTSDAMSIRISQRLLGCTLTNPLPERTSSL